MCDAIQDALPPPNDLCPSSYELGMMQQRPSWPQQALQPPAHKISRLESEF